MRKEWIKYTEETTRWSKNETDQIFSFFFLFFFPLACLVFFLLLNFVRHFFSREKMEIEDEHEQLKAVRRNCEKLGLLVSSSSSSDEKEEETTTTTISNCLRSLRALFSRKKEVSPKECLRVRSFLF